MTHRAQVWETTWGRRWCLGHICQFPTETPLTRALDDLQDSANEASGGGSPSRSRRVSQIDGSTEPLAAQGATANPAERPPLDRFSSASTSLSLARRLVLSLLAPDAQEEAPSGATAAAGADMPTHDSVVTCHSA